MDTYTTDASQDSAGPRRQTRTTSTIRPHAMHRRRPAPRRGLAVAELAICLPVIVLILFASIQACNLIYLKHATVSAAYEGALELSKSNASNSSVESRVQQVLAAQNVTGATIAIEPVGVNISQAPAGSPITIVVDAPTAGNISMTGFFPSPQNLETRLVATR